METKNTPAPWECVDSMSVRGPYFMGDTVSPGYLVAALPTSTPPDERRANALLIASAPELLEALQKCQTVLEWVVEQAGGPQCEHEGGVVCFCQENAAISTARAAIAEATGA